jgi:hypothetical protein
MTAMRHFAINRTRYAPERPKAQRPLIERRSKPGSALKLRCKIAGWSADYLNAGSPRKTASTPTRGPGKPVPWIDNHSAWRLAHILRFRDKFAVHFYFLVSLFDPIRPTANGISRGVLHLLP